MIGNIAEARECVLLSRIESQGYWFQSLLAEFRIAGVNGRAFRLGALASIAFKGFSKSGKQALFIGECTTNAVHPRVFLCTVADADPSCYHGKGIAGIFDQSRDQPSFFIHIGLKNLFGMSFERTDAISGWRELQTRLQCNNCGKRSIW